MVLESLVGPRYAEAKPWNMIFFGVIYSFVAVVLSLIIFRSQASLVVVFLTVFACIPLMHRAIRLEESREGTKYRRLLKDHSRALSFFMFLFLGFLITFVICFLVLPLLFPSLGDALFDTQLKTIQAINARASHIDASFYEVSGAATQGEFFFMILANNLKVLFFCIFFSFFYGAGAIFILTWNASVISTAIGQFIRENLSGTILVYFGVFSMGMIRYLTHGIFEIIAYFMGGLAGGIISVAVIRHEVGTERFKKVVMDSFDLIFVSVLVLVFAAFVEVYITPIFFS